MVKTEKKGNRIKHRSVLHRDQTCSEVEKNGPTGKTLNRGPHAGAVQGNVEVNGNGRQQSKRDWEKCPYLGGEFWGELRDRGQTEAAYPS